MLRLEKPYYSVKTVEPIRPFAANGCPYTLTRGVEKTVKVDITGGTAPYTYNGYFNGKLQFQASATSVQSVSFINDFAFEPAGTYLMFFSIAESGGTNVKSTTCTVTLVDAPLPFTCTFSIS